MKTIGILTLGVLWLIASNGTAQAADPFAVPTYECMGLYWNPAEAGAENECAVHYRPKGEEYWRQGYPLSFNDQLDENTRGGKYRGSLVGLTSGTEYEIRLSLEHGAEQTLTAST